jgi:hypothetical protein
MSIRPTSSMPIRKGPVTFPPAAGGTGLMLPALLIAADAGAAQVNVAHAARLNVHARRTLPRKLPNSADLVCIAKVLKLR